MVLFTADILLLFHTGFVISYNLKKKLILSGPAVARYYICHGSFIFDAVSTVPLWMEVHRGRSSAHGVAQRMCCSTGAAMHSACPELSGAAPPHCGCHASCCPTEAALG